LCCLQLLFFFLRKARSRLREAGLASHTGGESGIRTPDLRIMIPSL
jgi:hypothetical protein